LVLVSEKTKKGIEKIIPFRKSARNNCVAPTVFPKINRVRKTPGTRTGFKYSKKETPKPREAIPKSIVPKMKPYAVFLTNNLTMKGLLVSAQCRFFNDSINSATTDFP